MITNISEKLKISGIYKINYSNGKIYIGQAGSIYKRALEHNNKNQYPCDKALKKYDATIEVLEQVTDLLLLDEKESKWIQFFDATNKEKGYNICIEGNASGKKGVENRNAAFNEQELNQVINLLINRLDLSYIDIAKIFNVSQATIFKISNGYSYVNDNLQYPLRKNNHISTKKENLKDYFDDEQKLLNLKDDLLWRWDLKIDPDLKEKYQIPLKVLRAINQGKIFTDYGQYTYPIRQKNYRNNNNFSQGDIIKILSDLRNTKLTMVKIGEKYNIHRDTVKKINLGQTYPIKGYNYPAR